eukprot:10944057-Lingulodinium_polyedra.AAC.1
MHTAVYHIAIFAFLERDAQLARALRHGRTGLQSTAAPLPNRKRDGCRMSEGFTSCTSGTVQDKEAV